LGNGASREKNIPSTLQEAGDLLGEPVEVRTASECSHYWFFFQISTIRREDVAFHRGFREYDDILQCNNSPSSATARGHQTPAGFLILASGLDEVRISYWQIVFIRDEYFSTICLRKNQFHTRTWIVQEVLDLSAVCRLRHRYWCLQQSISCQDWNDESIFDFKKLIFNFGHFSIYEIRVLNKTLSFIFIHWNDILCALFLLVNTWKFLGV